MEETDHEGKPLTYWGGLEKKSMEAKETLEEAADNYSNGWGQEDDKTSFIAGAKWQLEQLQHQLSEANERVKEMESAIKKYEDELGYNKQRPDGMNGKF